MPSTKVITPSMLAKDMLAEEEPELQYDWSKQARLEGVERSRLAKPQIKPGSRRSRKAKGPK